MKEIHLESVDSTQNYAKSEAHTFSASDITCITAEEQTAGRGRYQRKWVSPPQVNLYVTFYFQLPAKSPHLTCLAQLMAYSFTRVLLREEMDPKIKWPNDILLHRKKVSGVLCETQFDRHLVHVFLGIGINVNLEREEAMKIDQPATSLKIETGRSWDKKELLRRLQDQFSSDLEVFKEKGFAPFHARFENLLAYRGEKVSVFDGQREWIGICHSLTNEGQLNLLLPDGNLHAVFSGDLSLS